MGEWGPSDAPRAPHGGPVRDAGVQRTVRDRAIRGGVAARAGDHLEILRQDDRREDVTTCPTHFARNIAIIFDPWKLGARSREQSIGGHLLPLRTAGAIGQSPRVEDLFRRAESREPRLRQVYPNEESEEQPSPVHQPRERYAQHHQCPRHDVNRLLR